MQFAYITLFGPWGPLPAGGLVTPSTDADTAAGQVKGWLAYGSCLEDRAPARPSSKPSVGRHTEVLHLFGGYFGVHRRRSTGRGLVVGSGSPSTDSIPPPGNRREGQGMVVVVALRIAPWPEPRTAVLIPSSRSGKVLSILGDSKKFEQDRIFDASWKL
ncbi:hypothetical protein THAOC_08691 [Thalassiosira oceanica]|uniref:Uncharacterized protein n=1 Tax=Thalassiosira oceanica TaxID=159749 RepID=K0SUB5_THAOC|nr:hypothetical protein THAOC_08691 [Thalassiosira oceanica]|eukprot:EJK69993.1 hypothetical protein THAOC_08691 [Thalassiosira oceanica]